MATSDKKQVLEWVHYTEQKFKGDGATLFGETQSDLTYAYLDRLFQKNAEKYRQAEKVARLLACDDTAMWYEALLSAYFDKVIDLKHIAAGIDANGTTYYSIGYLQK